MGQNSEISWTTHTFNPWIGCTKVSDGCKFCYAEAMMDHRYGKVKWGPNGTRVRTAASNWRQPIKWNKAAKEAGERHRVFCASLADVFEDREELKPWRADLCILIEQCRNLDFLLLTKRPENVNRMISDATGRYAHAWLADCKHVWIGTSVENQEAANVRIPHLLKVPASVRFLSCEPLLGPVDLVLRGLPGWDEDWKLNTLTGKEWASPRDDSEPSIDAPRIHWVIVGGESSYRARPMQPDWARKIRDDCAEHNVPYHFKQWGGANKKAAGRLLDGVEHNGFPERAETVKA